LTNNQYDIIVIGGGHNGLTASALLAKKGKKVLLLEKRSIMGGIAAGEEFHPGYKTAGLLHDTSGVRTSVIKTLQLDKYGLKTTDERPVVTLLSKNGSGVSLYQDKIKTFHEISCFSEKDAEAYVEYRDFIDKISGFINGLLNEAPPDLQNLGSKQLWALAKKGLALKQLGKRTMLEFLRVAPMCVADFLNDRFETDFLKAGIGAPAIYGSWTGPWSAGTTLNLLFYECTANQNVVGGPQALISALESAAKDLGVDVRTDVTVERILLDQQGRVEGVKITGNGSSEGEEFHAPVVAASCTPRETFLKLLPSNEIEYRLEHGITYFRSRGTTAKVNLALGKPLEFKYNAENSIEFIRTGNSFDEMEKAFDSVKYRKFSDEPILDIHIPTNSNPDFAPSGHAVASILVHFAPYEFDQGWSDEQKKILEEKVIKCLEQYTNNLSGSIIASEILSPVDLEDRYGLTEGHIYHGEHAIDQLITRPIPSCMRYKTPIPGLYLCGSGSHPGGGVTCAPGMLAAEAILKT